MKQIEVNGCIHHVEIVGTGKPIVFLHGLYMDHTIWMQQASRFSKTHQVILYDQRGHGKTQKGDQKVTLDQLADDLSALIENIHLQDPVLIGYSSAGAIILNTLVRYPQIARAAIVTGAFADTRGSYLRFNEKLGLMGTTNRWKRTTALLLAWNHATSIREFRVFYASVMRCNQAAVQDILDDMERFDISERLRHISCPLLLLYGTREHPNYRAEMVDIFKHVPSAHLHFIKGVRHATMTKTANHFYQEVNQFLQTIPK